jgi:predicted restriction endonuclease
MKKQIRSSFRESVFKRDNYTCQLCGQKYSKELSDPSLKMINAHHIMDRHLFKNGGYILENGITLCDENGKFTTEKSCHMLVEGWHIHNGNEEMVLPEHRPNTLYKKINSSFELALTKDKSLK